MIIGSEQLMYETICRMRQKILLSIRYILAPTEKLFQLVRSNAKGYFVLDNDGDVKSEFALKRYVMVPSADNLMGAKQSSTVEIDL